MASTNQSSEYGLYSVTAGRTGSQVQYGRNSQFRHYQPAVNEGAPLLRIAHTSVVGFEVSLGQWPRWLTGACRTGPPTASNRSSVLVLSRPMIGSAPRGRTHPVLSSKSSFARGWLVWYTRVGSGAKTAVLILEHSIEVSVRAPDRVVLPEA